MLTTRLSEAYLAAGRVVDALALAIRARDLAMEHNGRGHEARALHLLGAIASYRNPPDNTTAEGYHRQALALATELGMRPLVAHCHLGLGKLDHRPEKRQTAQEHFATATAMYREMDMQLWLQKAEAEMRQRE
jgi:hypothetical protein